MHICACKLAKKRGGRALALAAQYMEIFNWIVASRAAKMRRLRLGLRDQVQTIVSRRTQAVTAFNLLQLHMTLHDNKHYSSEWGARLATAVHRAPISRSRASCATSPVSNSGGMPSIPTAAPINAPRAEPRWQFSTSIGVGEQGTAEGVRGRLRILVSQVEHDRQRVGDVTCRPEHFVHRRSVR